MKKDEVWKQVIGIVTACLLSFSLLISPLSVQAQEDTSTLYVKDVNGAKLENGAVLITGQVVNPYPWDAVNVEITVIFDRDTTLYSTTTIDLVPKGGQANFTVSKLNAENLNTFITIVTKFSLVSDDVNALLKLYNESDSFVVQDAVQRSFPLMTEKALPGLLACIDTSQRGESYDLQQNLNDLICLGGLQTLAKEDSVPPLLQLLSWYETRQMIDLQAIKQLLVTEQYSSAWYLPILDKFDPLFGTLDELIIPILIKIGPAGVPELVEVQSRGTPLAQQAARTALTDIESDLMQSLDEVQDVPKLIDVIEALGALGKGEAVQSMLEMAQVNPDLIEAVDQSIVTMGVPAFPGLLESLAHPTQAVADQSEQLLLVLATQSPAEFLGAVQTEMGSVPDGNVESVITQLRQQADQQVKKEIDARFMQAWSEYDEAGCEAGYSSILEMQDLFAGRSIIAGRENEVAQIYTCKARALAQTGDFEMALSLGEMSIKMNPLQNDLMKDLESWSILKIRTSIHSKQWAEAQTLIEKYKQEYPSSPAGKELESELFYSHYRGPLIAVGLVALTTFIFMIVMLVRRQNFSRRFRQVLVDTNSSSVQAFNTVYVEQEEEKRRKFIDDHLTNATADSYSKIARYNNILGKDVLASILELQGNSRIKPDKQVDMLADIVLHKVKNGWKQSLEKLVKLDKGRAWDCSKNLLFTENKIEAMVVYLSKMKGKAYNDAINNLFQEAINYPVQSRAGLVNLLDTGLQHSTGQEIEVFLQACLELPVPDTKALYTLNNEEGLTAWRTLLSKDDGKLAQRWGAQLQSTKAQFHTEALVTALKIAGSSSTGRKAHIREQGADRMCQILVCSMLRSEGSVTRKIGKELLGILGRDGTLAKIIVELKKEDLRSLQSLMDSENDLRQLAMGVIQEARKNSELEQDCLDLLTKTFHEGPETAAVDAFNALLKPGDPRYDTEIEWIVSHGKAHHAKLLLHRVGDEFQHSVIAGLVGAVKAKKADGNRVAIVYDWIKDFSSMNKMTQAATTLLGLSLLDKERTLQQWRKEPGKWAVEAVRLAMAQPDSPLPELLLEWCHNPNEKLAAEGIQLLGKLAGG